MSVTEDLIKLIGIDEESKTEEVRKCPSCGGIYFIRACVVNTDGYYHPTKSYICQNKDCGFVIYGW